MRVDLGGGHLSGFTTAHPTPRPTGERQQRARGAAARALIWASPTALRSPTALKFVALLERFNGAIWTLENVAELHQFFVAQFHLSTDLSTHCLRTLNGAGTR